MVAGDHYQHRPPDRIDLCPSQQISPPRKGAGSVVPDQNPDRGQSVGPVYEPLHSGRQGAVIEGIGQRPENAGVDAGVPGLLHPQSKQLPAMPISERGRAVFQIIRGALPVFPRRGRQNP